MIYDDAFFDRELNRHGTFCEKWERPEKLTGKAMNPMWVADMDFEGPREITEALVKRAAHPAYGYTFESEGAIRAMLSFMERRHHLVLNEKEQRMLPCVITGLRAAVLHFTRPGESVIIQPPVYGPFYQSIEENGRKAALCPLKREENGRYFMDYEAVEEACRQGARLMMICSPHNPVSRLWSREELQTLLDILRKYRVPLVCDEIHEDFVYQPDTFTPILSFVTDPEENILALTSASKTFNIAGLQQAVVFSRNTALLAELEKEMHAAGVVQGNIFAMVATEAAYGCDDWLDAMLRYIKAGEEIFRRELAAALPEAVLSPLDATYLGWVDLRPYGFTTEALMNRCRGEGVEFTPGTFFGKECGDGFLRVNLACPHERVALAARQLSRAVLKK